MRGPDTEGRTVGPDTIDRVRRAVTLDASLYQEADQDDGLTGEAILVAALAGVVNGLLLWLLRDGGFSGVFTAGVGVVIGLFIWGGILLLVGKLFGGQAEYMGLVRSLGYAAAPNALSAVPFVGWLAGIWTLVCMVVAVRESHGVSTGLAVVIVLVPAVVIGVLVALLGLTLLAALLAF